MKGDWKKEAQKKKAQDEAIDHCFTDADKKRSLSDTEKQQEALNCSAKVLTMSPKDLEAWNAAHAKEASPSPLPANLPPSLEATLYAGLEGCDRESKKAKNPEEKREFLDYCHTKVVQEYERALAIDAAPAQAQRALQPAEALKAFAYDEMPTSEIPPEVRPSYAPAVIDPENITEMKIGYELESEAIRFEAAKPTRVGPPKLKGEGSFITRKFTLIPLGGSRYQLPFPEQVFVLFQKIVNQMIKLGMDDAALKEALASWRVEAEKNLQKAKKTMDAVGVSPPKTSIEAGEEESVSEEFEELEEDEKEEAEEPAKSAAVTDTTILVQDWQRKQRKVNWLNQCHSNLNFFFAKEGLPAAANFYQAIIKIPLYKKFKADCKAGSFKFLRVTGPLNLVDRVWRAAAQFAYFSVREYRRLLRTLPTIIVALGKLPDPTCLLERGFPEDEEFRAVLSAVTVPGLELKVGQLSKVSLGGWCRHVRNFVKRDLIKAQSSEIERIIQTSSLPSTLAPTLESWLTGVLGERLKAFLRTLSYRLTMRLKWVQHEHKQQEKAKRKGKEPRPSTFGKEPLDKAIKNILGGHKVVGLPLATWKALVKQWRDTAYTTLGAQLGQVPVVKITQNAFTAAVKGLTPTRLLTQFLARRPRYVTLADASWESFQKFLEASTISEAEARIADGLRPQLKPSIQTSLAAFQVYLTNQRVHAPVYTKQTIPLGTFNTMYEAPVMTASGPQGILKLLKSGSGPRVKASLIPFTLHTPGRFRAFADQYYVQGAGTLQRKGARLILAIPFQRTSQTPAAETSFQPEELPLGGGIDLGLKTLVVLHKAPVRQVAEGVWQEVSQKKEEKTQEQKDRERPLFIDQRYLEGKRSDWINQHSAPNLKLESGDSHHTRNLKARKRRHKSIPMGFNWKRRLSILQELVQQRQKAMAEAKEKDKGYRHKRAYWRLRREYKAAWQKVQDLHEEMARQLATRVIAACQQAHLVVLRMEDLSWSQHSPKWKRGSFITTWQIHWFFGRIQEHIIDLARRVGLRVELVNAYNTSIRCSKCGHEQKESRNKKRFQCRKCGFRLDADLNAARNILIAPLSNSPEAIASVG